jgi:pyrroloquinoline quinone biosynthesis protein E
MYMQENQHWRSYYSQYETKLQQASDYVKQPHKLRSEIEKQKKARCNTQLGLPEPDPFAIRMLRYKGFLKYPARLKNYIIAGNEPRSETRLHLPFIIDIEPNSQCNFRCTMCQVSSWNGGKRSPDMLLEELKSLIGRQPNLTEVKLHGIGEPLLHPNYIEMIQYLVDRQIWVRTNTNGSLLHLRDNYRRLIDAGIGEIQTSFDGATKEVFEKIRRRSNFEQVVENLTRLNAYANTKQRLYTRMWVLLQKDNRHQLLDFVAMAERMGFRRLSFSINLNHWGIEAWYRKNKPKQINGELTDEETDRLAETGKRSGIEITFWTQAQKYTTDDPQSLCPWPFQRPYISCDMRLVPCCMIGNPEVVDLGDARDFEETWNGSAYKSFRKAHLTGNIPPYCQNCYDLSSSVLK